MFKANNRKTRTKCEIFFADAPSKILTGVYVSGIRHLLEVTNQIYREICSLIIAW